MGAGKTTLIKALVQSLGSNDVVSSPTFSLVNEYEITDDKIYHFDLYRIRDENELLDIGFEDYIHSKHWVFIEWPEKAKDFIPIDSQLITIKTTKKTSRAIILSSNTNKKTNEAMKQQ